LILLIILKKITLFFLSSFSKKYFFEEKLSFISFLIEQLFKYKGHNLEQNVHSSRVFDLSN